MLRVPHTIGDIEISADIKARRITAGVTVLAPEDRGGRARCSWILGQLRDAPPGLVIEAYPKNARSPYTMTLADALENRDLLLGPDKRDPTKFRLLITQEMGAGRKSSRKPGFIDSILGLIELFYGTVVQNLSGWTPKAPKITEPKAVPVVVDDDHDDKDPRDNPPPVPEPSSPASPAFTVPVVEWRWTPPEE